MASGAVVLTEARAEPGLSCMETDQPQAAKYSAYISDSSRNGFTRRTLGCRVVTLHPSVRSPPDVDAALRPYAVPVPYTGENPGFPSGSIDSRIMRKDWRNVVTTAFSRRWRTATACAETSHRREESAWHRFACASLRLAI